MVSDMSDTQIRQQQLMGSHLPGWRQLASRECEKAAIATHGLQQHNQAKSQLTLCAQNIRNQHFYKPGGSAGHLPPDAGNTGHCFDHCRQQANTQSPLAWRNYTQGLEEGQTDHSRSSIEYLRTWEGYQGRWVWYSGTGGDSNTATEEGRD